MSVAADYARAASYLASSGLPAYVSFTEQATARGIGGPEREIPKRLYVRTGDGTIIDGAHPANSSILHSNSGDSASPFGQHAFFKPQCYTPTYENQVRWNGQSALRFELQASCRVDGGISELYADPQTLRPIAVEGSMRDTADSHMTVAFELRYATVDQYSVPSSFRAHVVGHGWLFWVRERAEVDYTGYQFYQTAESMRRQSPFNRGLFRHDEWD